MKRKRPRLYYTGMDFYGDESMTADEFPHTEDEHLDTGLLDATGEPIKRKSVRGPLGFQIAKE